MERKWRRKRENGFTANIRGRRKESDELTKTKEKKLLKDKKKIYGGGDDGLMVKEGPMALAGDGQDGRRVFSLVEEDGRLIGCLQFDLGGAW